VQFIKYTVFNLYEDSTLQISLQRSRTLPEYGSRKTVPNKYRSRNAFPNNAQLKQIMESIVSKHCPIKTDQGRHTVPNKYRSRNAFSTTAQSR
jgi:hypothetical protein